MFKVALYVQKKGLTKKLWWQIVFSKAGKFILFILINFTIPVYGILVCLLLLFVILQGKKYATDHPKEVQELNEKYV